MSVVGARGYSGQELVRHLLRHPHVKITAAFATEPFSLKNEIFEPGIENVTCLPDRELFNFQSDVVFLATPAEVSAHLAPKLIDQGSTVFDVSGAFRLRHEPMEKWYGFSLTENSADLKPEYGLVPFASAYGQTKLIANPGCYATSVLMALLPLVKKDLIDLESLVIDGKSGTTGAGRKAQESTLLSEAADNCTPYKVGRHQHLPEMIESVFNFTGQKMNPHFTTHLLPVRRGIICGLYAKSKTRNLKDLSEAYTEAYSNYPLVRFAHNDPSLTHLNKVVGTPMTHISFELIEDKLYIFSAIDNLLKGAATQAIENLNRVLDLPVSTGLLNSSVAKL